MASARDVSLSTLALVIAGGMVGVAARAALVLPVDAQAHPLVLPAVTLAINLVGSLALGIVVGRLGGEHSRLRAFLGTGVLGGFTTYSAFAVQTVDVFSAAPLVGLLLAAVSVLGGIVCAAFGLRMGRGARAEVPVPEAAE